MNRRVHPYALIVAATVAVAVAVTLVNVHQRRAADDAAHLSADANEMLEAMLDQETGLRGYALVPRQVFLEPYVQGRRDFADGLADARSDVADDDQARGLITAQAVVAHDWERLAQRRIARIRAGDRKINPTEALTRKGLMDRFRALNGDYRDDVEQRRKTALTTAAILAAVVVGLLSLAFGVIGVLLVRRRLKAEAAGERREQEFRERQDEFGDMLAVADDEEEANLLLKRHLERSTPDTRVIVFNRNNSEDRLEAHTPIRADGPIAAALESASPRDCLAVRMAKPHGEQPDDPALLQCSVCGREDIRSTCVPLLVSGSVIGSVLVEHTGAFGDTDRRRLGASVAQAAPVLANLRNLAMAEQRASTDVLTGLPNRRALQDTLKRSIAHASRTVTPMSVIALDLDRFKRINDQHGHEQGDSVLAAIGETIGQTVRASDFAGRNGGEEFLVVLPDTTLDGAREVAERLRTAIRSTDVAGLDRRVTASFGLATFPVDAADSEGLLRVADRALYLAKHNGRDRVEAVTDAGVVPEEVDAGTPG
jgi:diguanylate cyclase (GGDEF)-like protein